MQIKNNKKIHSFIKGMTVIELIVVLSIFVVITSVTIFNFGKYRSSESLNNLSDDVSLAIRKAQSQATGARGLNSAFDKSYGLHLTPDPLENTKIVLFVDNNNDDLYNESAGRTGGVACDANGVGTECLEILTMNSAYNISKISVVSSAHPVNDPLIIVGDRESIARPVEILFKRPNLDAKFCLPAAGRTGGLACDARVGGVISITIEIKNVQDNSFKNITIYNTGQISVQ